MFVLLLVLVLLVMFGILVYHKMKHRDCTSGKLLHGKTALVTGGTAGMGLETATELARRGAHVIIASPFPSEGKTALQHIKNEAGSSNVDFVLMDLSSLEDTRRAAKEIIEKYDQLHLLINNAGIGGPGDVTNDGFIRVIQVNYLGPFLLTLLLLPLLKKSGREEPSRVVNIASYLHVFGTYDVDRWRAGYNLVRSYSDSKLCLIMFTRELAKRLSSNVVVNCVHPGLVGTNIFGTAFCWLGPLLRVVATFLHKSPWQGAQTALHLALDERASHVTGQYFSDCQVSKASSKAYNELNSINLWDKSLEAVKLSADEVSLALK